MSLRVVVLGSGTAMPDVDRGPAGLAVSTADSAWWFDGGSGTLQRSARAGVDPLTLDGVVLSHHHPDHCADLVPLLFALRVAGRERPLRIVAGEGFEGLWSGLNAAWGKWITPPGGVVLTIIDRGAPQTLHLGDLTLRTAPAVHAAGALHLRAEQGGRSMTFSGDTGPSDALAALAAGTDLLVTECAATAGGSATHLSAADVVRLARAAHPHELWVTHINDHPDTPGRVDGEEVMAEVRAGLEGLTKVRRAADGDRWPA
jgi:ribonuclease BN (tRNA processing enzyme)